MPAAFTSRAPITRS